MKPIILPDEITQTSKPLESSWLLAKSNAGSYEQCVSRETEGLNWRPAQVPGTVGAILSADELHDNLDDFDWWYLCQFNEDDIANKNGRKYLNLDGLATIADIWLNGEFLLRSCNMFTPLRIDVTNALKTSNELCICFRSLTAEMSNRRPRPKWKTKLVGNQNMRWYRTSLLGRIPTWQPALSPVGPWKAISLDTVAQMQLIKTQLSTLLEGNNGVINASFSLNMLDDTLNITEAKLHIGDSVFAAELSRPDTQNSNIKITCHGNIPDVPQWWPHTHGEPNLLACQLKIKTTNDEHSFDLGNRGFKQIELEYDANTCGFKVNGEEIFCRGGVWSSNDIKSLVGDENELYKAIKLAQEAGFNMLRVGGTMCYETDTFYKLCDQLGIMVWQDFMFASMDYPVEDPGFLENVSEEVRHQVERLSAHVSIAAYCGNTDVQQQAAMVGAPKENWSNDFFDSVIPAICKNLHREIPYFPSTPSGGALPFHPDTGLAHYYGVGAFMLPLSDIDLAGIKFAPEGMGFAHVPEPALVNKIFNNGNPILHDPVWKAVVPRDAGAGWDFEDVRDHYLAQLFNIDPIHLRNYDSTRYLEMSRVVSGLVHLRVFAKLRSPSHPCRGALLWYYNDLVAGPGWGQIDSEKTPKAAYFALRRAFMSLGIYLEDKGLNGFHIHLHNETATPRNLNINIKAFRDNDVLTLDGQKQIRLEARQSQTLIADEILAHFSDATYAYKFGPVQHDVVHVELTDADTGEYLHDDSYFPVTHSLPRVKNIDLQAEIITRTGNAVYIKLCSPTFLQFVRLDFKSHRTEDNYFHLAPNCPRTIRIMNLDGDKDAALSPLDIKGYIEALNLSEPVRVNFKGN